MSTNDQAAISPSALAGSNGGGGSGAQPPRTPAPKPGGSGGQAASHGLFSIYKPGQGYWTRMLTAIGAGTVILSGVAWLWSELERMGDNARYWQMGMAVGIIAVFGGLLFHLLNKPRFADFLIATEAEMKKVNWPSRREVVGATIVVILGTLFIALLLFGIDIAFGWLFLKLGILEAGGAA